MSSPLFGNAGTGALLGYALGGTGRSAAIGALGGVLAGNVLGNQRDGPRRLLFGGAGKCRKDQVYNSKTGRCVLKSGVMGKKLLGKKKKSPKSPKRKSPSPSPGDRYSWKDLTKRYSPSINKKRAARNSPFKSAALTRVGTVMTGNDGDDYIVAIRGNGVHFWKRY
jgi:Ca2+-binding RTX toxin-like protein